MFQAGSMADIGHNSVWIRRVNGVDHLYAMWQTPMNGIWSGELRHVGATGLRPLAAEANRLSPGRLIANVGPYELRDLRTLATAAVDEDAQRTSMGGRHDELGTENA